ncbi:MAG: YgiQ family radical SAM protein [Desulfuromonadales bacterium]|nr:YgiQ family radical SAM protein [Desulfuromonadales bacterium]
MSFSPTTKSEMQRLGLKQLDVIFVTGDAYIDHPSFGVPLLARWLQLHGFSVGIIAQPDWKSKETFMTLGKPRLFFGVTAGAMDSMVAHYTPAKKLRRDDAYTPGNKHGARPNRATIVYTSCCKGAYRDVPVVIGGIEASLRRFAHYDYWEDKVRRSILPDSKADILVYGMGERQILAIGERLRRGEDFKSLSNIPGTAVLRKIDEVSGDCLELPSFEAVLSDKRSYAEAFRLVAKEQNPYSGKTVIQRYDNRFLVCNPPALPLTTKEMDLLYSAPFTKLPHTSYNEPIPAWEQIKGSVTSHRGCLGGCAFCAITFHQGKFIQSRSEDSILSEVKHVANESWSKGVITDIGGPTANMYGFECRAADSGYSCSRNSCIYPSICKSLHIVDSELASLLEKGRGVKGVRHISVASGVRYDFLPKQKKYFKELITHCIGGLMKVAPEHLSENVLAVMRKPGAKCFDSFLKFFYEESAKTGKRQSVVPYFISGHPGCSLNDMIDLAISLKKMGLKVEQVQDFTPTPGTLSTCIYYTGIDPFAGKAMYVPRKEREKHLQKSLLLSHIPEEKRNIMEALRICGRESDTELIFYGRSSRKPYNTHGAGKSGFKNKKLV